MKMLIGFVAGWLLGSLAMYTYMVLTAREPPYPECMDCDEQSCGDCVPPSEEEYRIAA